MRVINSTLSGKSPPLLQVPLRRVETEEISEANGEYRGDIAMGIVRRIRSDSCLRGAGGEPNAHVGSQQAPKEKDMRKLFTTKRRIALAVGVVALVATSASAAFAYFSGGAGSGAGSATVGTASPWSVTVEGAAGSASFGTGSSISPGNGTEFVPFMVTNVGTGNQYLVSVTPSMMTNATTGDAETATGADIPGCLASWFTVVNDPANPPFLEYAPGASYKGAVDVTMVDAFTSQNACENASPGVTVTASS